MKTFVGLSRLVYFVGSKHADTFHLYCYHGDKLNGKIFASLKSDKFVTQPDFPLLMSQEALDAILPLCRNITFELVETEYYPFDVPFEIGSFAHWDDPEFPGDDGECLIEHLAGMSAEKPKIKYALILPELEQTELVGDETLELHMGPTEWDPPIILKSKPPEHIVAFSAGHSHFLPPNIFEALRPYLIEELYTIRIFPESKK